MNTRNLRRFARLTACLLLAAGCNSGASCPDLSGRWTIVQHCIASNVGQTFSITQNECHFGLGAPFDYYTGTADEGGALRVAGPPGESQVVCRGQLSGAQAGLSCATPSACTVVMERGELQLDAGAPPTDIPAVDIPAVDIPTRTDVPVRADLPVSSLSPTPGSVWCFAAGTCGSASPVCCDVFTDGGYADRCVASLAACPAPNRAFQCEESADCGSGMCCARTGTSTSGTPYLAGAACRPSCASGEVQLCMSSADCGGCVPQHISGRNVGFCM